MARAAASTGTGELRTAWRAGGAESAGTAALCTSGLAPAGRVVTSLISCPLTNGPSTTRGAGALESGEVRPPSAFACLAGVLGLLGVLGWLGPGVLGWLPAGVVDEGRLPVVDGELGPAALEPVGVDVVRAGEDGCEG